MKKATIEQVLAQHPLLHKWGYGDGGWCRQPNDLHNLREELLTDDAVATISGIVTWLKKNTSKRKTINKKLNSYAWKVIAGNDLGYIANGEFITAALIAEFNMTKHQYNPCFNMNQRSP